jgi:hypothetical protein
MATSDSLLRSSPRDHIASRKSERSDELLQFPLNLGAHCTLMRFFQYTYGGAKGAVENPLAEIVLPLPKQIQDSFKINIAGDELGLSGAAAAQVAASVGNSEASGGVGSAIKNLASATTQAAENIGAAAGKAALGDFSAIQEGLGKTADAAGFLTLAGLGAVAPDIKNGIGAGRGTAVNPFQTLVFKGVDLKVHSLEWLLSPESEEEQRQLKKIIRTLQRMVLPKSQNPMGENSEFGLTAIDKGLLKYPAMVNIFLQGIDQNYYFKFKTSMISQLNVDYTPNGLSINKGGKPSAIRITMTLNEAYIHTSDDYSSDEIEAEAFVERLGDSIEDESALDTPSATEEFHNANANFSNLQNSDEIKVTKTLANGQVESSVIQKSVLTASGITEREITAGRPSTDETVKFESVS